MLIHILWFSLKKVYECHLVAMCDSVPVYDEG